ncbi:IS30 family transposase [Weissella diestrammenae]|uniref:IS30 family transposase n=1 Tax=Weissella diestrammenae TaxID=1162633 RepID=A0A7G9T3S0_9LACO|nr:IS30 family transposase [Weissella diestrammenae]MCM0582727.1 IS30 family transposase [Weissella diestrammenae]QNN74745.1 IS30 family transposase [Weissella diestrammenae]
MKSDDERKIIKTRRPKLNQSERLLIEHMWNVDQFSQSEIARRMNRDQGIISRELQKGNTVDFGQFSRKELLNLPIHARIKYSAFRAEYISKKRSFRYGQNTKLTPELQELIEHWINVEKWTPEQIAGNVPDVEVSASTIRQWARRGQIHINVGTRRNGSKVDKERDKTLREKQQELARLRQKLVESGDLVKHSIFDRPKTIEKRTQFGHWEIDLVLPAKTKDEVQFDNTAIMTFVERKSRFYTLIKIENKRADSVIKGFDLFYKRYGSMCRSITADNGIEFVSWTFLEHVQRELGVKIYYATPSSPHERGSNERKNRELRKYLPKGNTFRNINQPKLDALSDKINMKPMLQALNGKVPADVFEIEYTKLARNRRAYAKRKQKKSSE